SIAEAGRVLRPGGVFCASVTHPLQDAGKFASSSADAPFIIDGSYLGERRPFDAKIERDGYRMHFKGWAYPLESYARAQEKARLMIEKIREPRLAPPLPSLDAGGERWRRIPLFLMWRAVKT